MREKAQRLKEERLSLAITNGFFGLDGKIGHIAKYLGKPIEVEVSAQDGLFYTVESNPMPSVWDFVNDDEIPEAELDIFNDIPIQHIGLHFDGLSRGIHIEIKYIADAKELTLTYKGHLVYQEINGELECYIPNKEWENIVEKLYKDAKERFKENINLQILESENEAKNAKAKFIEKLKNKWGFC